MSDWGCFWLGLGFAAGCMFLAFGLNEIGEGLKVKRSYRGEIFELKKAILGVMAQWLRWDRLSEYPHAEGER